MDACCTYGEADRAHNLILVLILFVGCIHCRSWVKHWTVTGLIQVNQSGARVSLQNTKGSHLLFVAGCHPGTGNLMIMSPQGIDGVSADGVAQFRGQQKLRPEDLRLWSCSGWETKLAEWGSALATTIGWYVVSSCGTTNLNHYVTILVILVIQCGWEGETGGNNISSSSSHGNRQYPFHLSMTDMIADMLASGPHGYSSWRVREK